jgi:hypothetical protein
VNKNTRAMIITTVVAALIVVVGLVGYFEMRRLSDAAAERRRIEDDRTIASETPITDAAVDAMADAIESGVRSDYDKSLGLASRSATRIAIVLQRRGGEMYGAEPAIWAKKWVENRAVSRHAEKYAGSVAARQKAAADRERDDRIRRYEESIKAGRGGAGVK